MDAAEAETISRKKARRVSFADTTAIHVFDRDDEYETPPEARAAANSFESASGAGAASATEKPYGDAFESDDSRDSGFREDGGGDGTEPEDEPEPFVKDMDFSPGSTAGSVTSNDDDNLFGPVSSSFIMSGLASEASDDDAHDITLDSTAFSLHFRNILPSDEQTANSVGSMRTPTGEGVSSDSRRAGKRTRASKSRLSGGSGETPSAGAESSGSMSLVTLQRKTFDYGKLSPSLESLLQEVNKSLGVFSPNRVNGVASSSPAKNLTAVSSPAKNQSVDSQHHANSGDSKSAAAASTKEKMTDHEDLNEFLNALPPFGSPTTLELRGSPAKLKATPAGVSPRSNMKAPEDMVKGRRRSIFPTSSDTAGILSPDVQVPSSSDHNSVADGFCETSMNCQRTDAIAIPVSAEDTPATINTNNSVPVSRSAGAQRISVAVSAANEHISYPPEGSISSLRNKRQELSPLPLQSQPLSVQTPEGNLMKLASPLLNFSLLQSGSQSFLNLSRKLSTSHGKTDRYKSPLSSLSSGKLNFDFEVHDSDPLIPRTPVSASDATDLVSSPIKSSVSVVHDKHQQLLVEPMSFSKRQTLATQTSEDAIVKLKSPGLSTDDSQAISQLILHKSPISSTTLDSSVICVSGKATNNALDFNGSYFPSSHTLASSSACMMSSTPTELQTWQSSEGLTQHATANEKMDLASYNPTPKSNENSRLASTVRPEDARGHQALLKSLSSLDGKSITDGSTQPTTEICEYGNIDNKGVGSQTDANKSVCSPGLLSNPAACDFSTPIPLKCLEDTLSDVLRASSIQFSSIGMLNDKEIDVFESKLDELRNALKFERLLASIQSIMKLCHSNAEYNQRLIEANQLLYMAAYQHAKKKLLLARRDALLQRLQRLQLTTRECQKLKHASVQLLLDSNRGASHIMGDLKPTPEFPHYKNKDEQQTVMSMQKELANQEHQLNVSIDHLCAAYHLENANYDTVIKSVHELLRKKRSCHTLRKKMLVWNYASVSNQSDGSYIVLNYSDILYQRFFIKAARHSASYFRNTMETVNIMKRFPNVNACTAFDFVFNTKDDQLLSGSHCFQQVTQATNIILGNTLDLLEEVQAAQITISTLISVGFHLLSSSQLGLEFSFMNLNTGRKLVLILDMSSLRCGVYPADPAELHIQISESQTTLLSSSCGEIMSAIQLLKGGASMLTRVCQCISHVIQVSSQ